MRHSKKVEKIFVVRNDHHKTLEWFSFKFKNLYFFISLNDLLINSYRFSSQIFFHWSFKIIMSELVKFLVDQAEKEIKKVIKQLNILKSRQHYQLQCSILNHITKKMYDLKLKAKTLWKYVKSDKENWNSHHENEQTLKKTFSTLSKMIEATRKTKNNYEKTLRRINALWESKKKKFARDQFVQLLKSMRRCALRNLNLNDVRCVVNLTIKNWLMNLVKEMSTSRKSINRHWIRMIMSESWQFRITKSSKLDLIKLNLSTSHTHKLCTVDFLFSFFLKSIFSVININ